MVRFETSRSWHRSLSLVIYDDKDHNVFSTDCVYFESSSTSPYQIRRIEELNKTASGNVEAKVMCFYRRRDLPNPLIQLADKHQSEYEALHTRKSLRVLKHFFIFCVLTGLIIMNSQAYFFYFNITLFNA